MARRVPRHNVAAHFQLIDGVYHKLCKGPAHAEPTWLPANEKYFYVRKSGGREGELTTLCRLCGNWRKLKSPGSEQGWVPLQDARPFYTEAVNRIGVMELARRTSIAYGSIVRVVNGDGRYVQKAKLKLVMLELVSMRRKGETSMHPGSRWRLTDRAAGDAGTCGECGVPSQRYTDECGTCWDRKAGRERRFKAKRSRAAKKGHRTRQLRSAPPSP